METFVVKLRREHVLRLSGDYVTHWVATIDEPRVRATGRSLRTVERALRGRFEKLENWTQVANDVNFLFRLEETPDAVQEALLLAATTADAAEQAAEDSRMAAASALRALILGSPSMSIRDAARIVGVKKTLAHELVSERYVIDEVSLQRLREIQREEALQARREARVAPAVPGSERAQLRAAWAARWARVRSMRLGMKLRAKRRRPRRLKRSG